MRVHVQCSVCSLGHRADLRDLPDAKIVCPFCEHDAQLPEDEEIARIEQQTSRDCLQTVLGVSLFAFAIGLTAAYASLSEAHPGEPLFGIPLAAGAALLAIIGLIVTVMQESKADRKVF